jgi:uncharacterized small protein (DUF1192 family)/DNA-directed RNA polymerase subunit RPC12/RpoP
MAGRVSGVLKAMGFHLGQDQRKQILALDSEFEEMESKITSLNAKVLNLEAKVNPLEREIERLKNQGEKKGATVHDLESDEIEMMKFIGDRKSITAEDIGKGMKMHSVPVEHFLGRLLKANYLVQQNVPMVGAMYSLDDAGNAYLVKNKLVPLPNRQAEQPNNPKGHHCDHCGSTQLRRTGSRPDPTFHDLGIKQALYSCLSCGKESAFTKDES